jgi:hypothetical protein
MSKTGVPPGLSPSSLREDQFPDAFHSEYALEPILLSAQLCEMEGKHAEALAEARRALDSATQVDLGSMRMQSRLVLAKIELQSRNRGPGRSHLQQLETDADARGFQLIANEARRVLASN